VSAGGLLAWLDMAFAAEPAGALIEVRWRLPDRPGMGQLWHPVERREAAIESIRSIGAKTDCFAGVCPRARREGGRDAVERGHVLWSDLDSPESIEALECFEPAPSMVIRSGGGGRHAYWSLWPPLSPDWVEKANRRMAYALGGDARSCDAARILRPPGTFNFKTGSPVPVEVEHLAFNVYAAQEVVGALPDPPTPEKPERRARTVEGDLGDPIRAVPLPVAIEVLVGEGVPRSGMVRCPSADHEDKRPSCHVEADVFYCHGCGRGGSIVDLGALLWKIEPRGAGYHEIRRRLEAELLPALRRAAA